MEINNVIIKPLVTEKSALLSGKDVYAFAVRTDANKHEISEAVKKLYSAEVLSVRVMNLKGKRVRVPKSRRTVSRKNWKKAYVHVAPGAKMESLSIKESK